MLRYPLNHGCPLLGSWDWLHDIIGHGQRGQIGIVQRRVGPRRGSLAGKRQISGEQLAPGYIGSRVLGMTGQPFGQSGGAGRIDPLAKIEIDQFPLGHDRLGRVA